MSLSELSTSIGGGSGDDRYAFISHSPDTFSKSEPTIDNAQLARRKRRRTSANELAVLENEFTLCQKPSKDRRRAIADRVGMTDKAVQIWFQNRRQSVRKAALKTDPGLSSSSDLSAPSPLSWSLSQSDYGAAANGLLRSKSISSIISTAGASPSESVGSEYLASRSTSFSSAAIDTPPLSRSSSFSATNNSNLSAIARPKSTPPTVTARAVKGPITDENARPRIPSLQRIPTSSRSSPSSLSGTPVRLCMSDDGRATVVEQAAAARSPLTPLSESNLNVRAARVPPSMGLGKKARLAAEVLSKSMHKNYPTKAFAPLTPDSEPRRISASRSRSVGITGTPTKKLHVLNPLSPATAEREKECITNLLSLRSGAWN